MEKEKRQQLKLLTHWQTQAKILLQHFITTLVVQTENEILGLNFRAPSNPETRTLSSVAPLFDSALPAQGLQRDKTGTRDRTLQLTNPAEKLPPVKGEDDHKPMSCIPF